MEMRQGCMGAGGRGKRCRGTEGFLEAQSEHLKTASVSGFLLLFVVHLTSQ